NKLKEENSSTIIVNQTTIGSIFGSLNNNYYMYKKKGKLPNLWENGTSYDIIVEDIYKKLSEYEIIIQNDEFLKKFVKWLHYRLSENIKLNNTSTKIVRDDLNFFYKNNNYTEYIKCLISYSNIDNKNKYTSRKKSFLNTKQNFDSNDKNQQIQKYKKRLFERITNSDWYEKYIDLHIKEFPVKLCNYCKDIDLMQTGDFYNIFELKRLFNNNHKILLLGNPGAGKTTALLNLSLNCLYDSEYIPIYIELNRYNEEPINEFIKNSTNIDVLSENNKKYIFFFDGLNEVKNKGSNLYNYIQNMPYEFENCRTVISCRLNNYSRMLNDFDTYVILPMSQSDIINYLEIGFPGEARDIYRKMNLKLKELSSSPIILTMIEGVLKHSRKFPTNMVELYQGFIEYILCYWETVKVSEFTMYDKVKILRELASFMYFKKGTNTCSIEEVQRIISKFIEKIGYSKEYQQKMYEELLTDGIIQQKIYISPMTVSFSHDSMLEFFVSKALLKDFEDKKYTVFEKISLDIGVLQFLKDLIIDDKGLLLILNNREISEDKNYLQSNVLSILHLKRFSFEGYDLSNLYFPKAKLQNASFFRANLNNTVLKGSDLRGVNLTEANLNYADLSNCILSGISFLRCSIRSIANLDYNRIAYVGDSTKAKIWERENNKQFELEGSHISRIRKIVFDNANGFIAAGSYDDSISLWNLDGSLKKKLNYHSDPVLALSFSPDGKYLVSGDGVGKIIIYNISDDNVLRILNNHKDVVREIEFINKYQFVSASWDQKVLLWNLRELKLEKLLCKHSNYAFSVSSHPTKNIVASVGADRFIKIVNLNLEIIISIDSGISLRDVEYSKDGNYLAVGGKTGKVQIWKDRVMCIEWEAHYLCVRDFIFVENDVLITSGDDATIRIWKIDYERATANCLCEMVDKEIYNTDGKNVMCKGLRIENVHGIPPERRDWLYENGAL
ncbi:MAG: pentapeptide repeat-containing protein, partial [Clostridiales bacterium]